MRGYFGGDVIKAIKSISTSVLLLTIAIGGHAAVVPRTIPIGQRVLYEVHQAIFDAYLAFFDEEMDSTIKNLIENAKQKSFQKIAAMSELNLSLFLLDNLPLLHSKLLLKIYYLWLAKDKEEARTVTREALEPLRKFIRGLPSSSIRKIEVADRLKLFALLVRADVNLLRQMGYYLRMFYVDAIYGSFIGEKVAGFNDPGHREADIMPSFPAVHTGLRYNKHKRRIEGHLDLVMVGSGATSMIASSELQKKGLDIMVVEKGSLVVPRSLDTTSHFKFLENRGPHLSEDGSVAVLNAETVGGGTTVNLDMSFAPTLPYIRHRFHSWHKKGLIPHSLWTDGEIDSAYAKVYDLLKPRVVGFDEINANNMILKAGAEALGIPTTRYELNTYAPDDPEKPEVHSKKSRFETLLLPAMLDAEHPATLLSDCAVEKVLIKHDRAYGVECRYNPRDEGYGIISDINGFQIKPNTKVRIYADQVVLAAGALGSTGVLLNSDIDNDNIGKGLVCHPFIPMAGYFPDKVIRADLGEPSTVLLDHFMPTDQNPDAPGFLIEAGLGRMTLGALLMPGTPGQIRTNVENIDRLGGFAVLLIDEPNNYNRIERGSSGRLKIFYRLSKGDKRRFIEGIKTAVNILFSAGASDVTFNSFEEPLFLNDDIESNTLTPDMNLEDVFKNFKLERNMTNPLCAHLTGTNKIGTSPKNSVVNADYQVWGVKDLYLIDGSLYPGSVGANPEMTFNTGAMIFAERFARAKGL